MTYLREDAEPRHLAADEVIPPRTVVRHPEFGAITFRCPCGERDVYVTSPPHGIDFDDRGRLTIQGSCGYRAQGDRPQNWCHFFIRNGEPEMCADAKCPGK